MSTAGALAARLAVVAITDASCGPGRTLVEVVTAVLRGGIPAIQLRAKREPTRDMVELGRALRAETRRAGALLFVNDRVDVALVIGADGAHLGDDDLPLPAARSITPQGFLLGRSVDTAQQAAEAERQGADYVGVGPVFQTASKADAGPAVGIQRVSAVRSATALPLVAIGGIDAANAAGVARAGADGVAVIRALMQARDPEAAARELLAEVRGEP